MDEFFKQYGTDSASLIIRQLLWVIQNPEKAVLRERYVEVGAKLADDLQAGLRKQYG